MDEKQKAGLEQAEENKPVVSVEPVEEKRFKPRITDITDQFIGKSLILTGQQKPPSK